MHKRLFIVAALALTFVACEQAPQEPSVSPQEVLKRATGASQTMESVRYEAVIDFTTAMLELFSIEAHVKVDGVLTNEGEQAAFTVDGNVTSTAENETTTVTGLLDVIVAGINDVYVQIQTLESTGEDPLFDPALISTVQNQWWQIPSDSSNQQMVTPDPRLYQLQTEIVTIQDDLGITNVNGNDVHHYRVTVDPDKFAQFMQIQFEDDPLQQQQIEAILGETVMQGELWIDTQTFVLRKIQWNVSKTDTNIGNGTFTVSFTIFFSEHNSIEPIIPPADAKLFAPALFGLEDITQQPEHNFPDNFEELTPQQQQELLQSILEDQAILPPPNE